MSTLEDLVFDAAPPASADLVFGDFDPTGPLVEAYLAIAIAGPGLAAIAKRVAETHLAIAIAGPSLTAVGEYRSQTDRPLVGQVRVAYQQAIHGEDGIGHRSQDSAPLSEDFKGKYQDATKIAGQVSGSFQQSLNLRNDTFVRHQDGIRTQAASEARFQEMLHDVRMLAQIDFQDAIARRTWSGARYQDRFRDRRNWLQTRYQDARPVGIEELGLFGVASVLRNYYTARWQEGIVPRPGMEQPTIPPGPTPCYIPPHGDAVHLVFVDTTNGADLLFVCETHGGPVNPPAVVVPIRSVYIVINTTSLRRVVGNIPLACYNLSMSIDVDSWTWGFSASLPREMIDYLQPDTDGLPRELEVTINGNAYRLLAENIESERQFGKAAIRLSGRGKGAYLADPYAPILTFANSEERTAQQLMADVLTFNGIPLGWDIDWQLTDWLVPAGVFSKQGSYIDGLSAIAQAAGAYIQPHPTDQQLSVLLRYPVMPWNWLTDVTPDFSLPSAVTTRESISWKTAPDYNRVFVSGTRNGVLGRVTRTGTAGDLLAPMVTDPLTTEAAAARQRGMAILGDTGRQALVGLRLPVLPETGVITPGKFVLYDDLGTQRLGIVRSTSVDIGMPDVWQSLQVETHEGA